MKILMDWGYRRLGTAPGWYVHWIIQIGLRQCRSQTGYKDRETAITAARRFIREIRDSTETP